MTETSLDTLHPSLLLGYFAVVLLFTMSAVHPALLAISLASSIIVGVWLRDGISLLKSFAWQLPLLAIIVIINPLFSSTGTVELFRIGANAVYLESIANACYMGCMLIAVMQWFANANCVIGSEKLMATLGKKLPVISLMITMIARLIPRFVQRGQAIDASIAACTAAHPQYPLPNNEEPLHKRAKALKKQNIIQSKLRTITTLMSWSMEDSLESADSMKSRGWGASPNRTTYQRYSFTFFDGIALAVLLASTALNGVIAIILCSQFGFFPSIHGSLISFTLIPYSVLFFLPLLFEACSVLNRKVRS